VSELLQDVDDLEDDPGVGLSVVILVRAEARGVDEDHWPAGVSPPHPLPEARGDCAGFWLVTDVKEDLGVARTVEDEVKEGGLALPSLADGGDYEPLVWVCGKLDHGGSGHGCDLFLAREEVCDNRGVMQDVSVRYAGGGGDMRLAQSLAGH